MHIASILYMLNRVIFQNVKIYCIQSGSFIRTADSTQASNIGMLILFDIQSPPILITNTVTSFEFCFCELSEKFEENTLPI